MADHDFHSQPLGQRLKFLRDNYPDFASLPDQEQGKRVATAQLDSMNLPHESDADSGFWSTLGNGVLGMLGGARRMASAALNPGQAGEVARQELMNGFSTSQHEQFQKGREALAHDDPVEGAGRMVAGAVPLFGPAAAEIGENIRDGHYGKAAANALLLGGPEAWNKFGPKIIETPNPVVPTDVLNPVERKAIDFAKSRNIPASVGQDTGQHGLQRVEQGLVNLPGSATTAHQFYRSQEDALADTGAQLARSPVVGNNPPPPTSGYTGPGANRIPGSGIIPSVNGFGAGTAVHDAIQSRINALRDYADKLYDSTRNTTSRNLQNLPGGKVSYVRNPAADIDPTASPTMAVPVLEPMESPIDLRSIRRKLQPVYDEFSRKLTTSQKEYMPAFAALKDIMENGATHMPAMDFDKFLGALKSISRDGSSDILTSPSQRMARQIISEGETQFQKAISGAGPNVADKLARARKAVKEYHDTDEFLRALQNSHKEPGVLYNNLTTGGTLPASGDRVRNILGELDRIAPGAIKTVARTFLEGMVEKATKEGGFSKADGVAADWKRMGPETKKLLFGDKLTADIDNFFLASKRLKAMSAPGTAHIVTALGGLGAAGGMILSLALGRPHEAAMFGMSTVVAPYIAAKILFRPGGASTMTKVLTLPVNSPAFNHAMTTLNAMAIAENPPAPPKPDLPQGLK